MSYLDQETSVHGGSPFELYEFTRGNQAWRYTSRGGAITTLGHTWAATPIGRTEISQSAEMAKNGITLSFPLDHAFARQFLGAIPEEVTHVVIRRGHSDDPDEDIIVYWKGLVDSSKTSGSMIELECQSIFARLRRSVLRTRYQKACRHPVYGLGWGAESICTRTGSVPL